MSYQSRPAHFQMLFNLFSASLQEYEEQTGIAISKHPLAEQLRYTDSAESVTAILQEQVPACSEFGGTDKIMKSLSSVVSVLYALSTSVDLNLPSPLIEPIFAGFAILIATVEDVTALDPLVDLLKSIESFLKHLDICTKVPHTSAMTETLVKTLVELLSILGLATKFVKKRQSGIFVKNLFGENFDQIVLERLDRLTLDEGRITALQILKVVYGLLRNMRVVMDDGKSSTNGILDDLEIMHRIVTDVNKSKRDKLQQDIQSWLSPPDPSINHQIACELRHMRTTAWFVQCNTFLKWKWSETSSLLWIHGKPGAGKTILCSAIIQDIDTMKRAGLVSLAYYYCDFRDDKKKDLRGLVSSLLVQLCHQSESYCGMVFKFYWEHAMGSRCPSDAALVLCLEGLLKLHGRAPVYLILDALDEFPIVSHLPSPQDKVLKLIRKLMTSQLPNIRVCVTSRLESDLSVVLEPLSFSSISLHDESGQKEDIASYIKSVVHTDPKMQTWRAGDKELVINVLTHKVDGIFQWAFCQFAYLRRCPRERIRRTLNDLPETLDECYRRILRDIDEADRRLAHRLFSCVSVARHPLDAEELSELLVFNFKGGPFQLFRRGWRKEDLINAVQTTYSSLLVIVEDGDTTVIQFSHFSVQEFFENAILANASTDASYYHVPMAPTHTLVAQACLDVLLHLDKDVITRDSLRGFPLAEYAAEHWLDHVRFGNLSNNVEDRMKQLFDPRKSHLASCLWIHDPEVPRWMQVERIERPSPLIETPLHYAASWGLHAIVRFLVIEHSQDVQAPRFTNVVTPLHQAAKKGHLEVARFLLECGANVTARDKYGFTPLHLASREGQLQVARLLIDHGAHVDVLGRNRLTPLHLASREGQLKVAVFLIVQGADVNARNVANFTPLHLASQENQVQVARVLIDHGADVNAPGINILTPLHRALLVGHLEVARILIDHGADVNARDVNVFTPLHLASREGQLQVARFLLDHGADVDARGMNRLTPLHLASREARLEVARFLIDFGADVDARDVNRMTPLHLASREGQPHVAGVLLEHNADADARDDRNYTSLHLASQLGHLEVVRVLIKHGTDPNARDHSNWTPLHGAAQEGHLNVVHFLINHGANLNASDHGGWTPLQLPSHNGDLETVRVLLKHGANVNTRDNSHWTPLHGALQRGHSDVVRLFLEHGADVDSRDDGNQTPLHVAARAGYPELLRLLVQSGANIHARNNEGRTPLEEVLVKGHRDTVREDSA